jgi:hypothetical protein
VGGDGDISRNSSSNAVLSADDDASSKLDFRPEKGKEPRSDEPGG